MKNEINGNNKLLWPNIVKIIIALLATTVVIILTIRFFYYSDVSVKFNKNYIFCYRNTTFGSTEEEDDKIIPVSKYSYFDSLTLNFTVMNNNPFKNYFVGNLYLYISESEEDIKKLIKGKKVDPSTFFTYKAMYIFNNFSWEDVEDFVNKGSYRVIGVSANDVKDLNIEFYPLSWYAEDRNKYNFKGDTEYYIVLLEEDFKGNIKFLNEDEIFKITIYQNAINYLSSFDHEKANIY